MKEEFAINDCSKSFMGILQKITQSYTKSYRKFFLH